MRSRLAESFPVALPRQVSCHREGLPQPMTKSLRRTSVLVCLGVALSAMLSAATPAFSESGTLDPILRGRARQLTGRSRVIVEYRGTADVRAVTAVRGRAGRRLS